MAISIKGPRRVSLRWKLVAMMASTTAVSLLLLGVGLMLRERQEFTRETEERLVLLADVIGLNSTAALAFNDAVAATETLAALRTDGQVMAGALYNGKGELFAQYRRADIEQPIPQSAPPISALQVDDETASLVRAIRLNGRSLGSVYLLADMERWYQALWQFIGIIGLFFIASLAVGVFVSTWLQRIVTEPIVELVSLMQRVGRERDFSLRATKRSNDELGFLATGFNGMIDEISKSHEEIGRGKDELAKLNHELEQRVRDRTAQLESANKELEAFSYSVSHDLRSPLRAIDGFSAAISEDCSEQLDAQGKEYLQRVRGGCRRMSQLIDDLLALSNVTRREMRQEIVDLSAIARSVAEQLTQAERDRAAAFTIADGIRVKGDSGLLRVALENLLGNAWKFTKGATNPRIEVYVTEKDGRRALCVRDNGAGFDMTYADKLFRAFQRLHDASEFPGTGIGLATVQRVVHRHGGRLWAEGAVKQGASFYFTIEEVA